MWGVRADFVSLWGGASRTRVKGEAKGCRGVTIAKMRSLAKRSSTRFERKRPLRDFGRAAPAMAR